jgi:hypothetical protein
MADHMIAKVAEALALRAAFPHDLGGIYAPEEMGNIAAESEPEEQPIWRKGKIEIIEMQPEPAPLPKASPEQAAQVLAKVREVIPEAQLVATVDADEQIAKAKVDPRSRRGFLLRSAAEAGVTLEQVERWLDHPFAEIKPDEVDQLLMDLSRVKAGVDSFDAVTNERLKM